MKPLTLAALLAVPCLASAVTLTKVATPAAGGKTLAIDDAERLIDGSWAVCDSLGACLRSVDKGANWSAIPALTGDTAVIQGRALVSKGLQVWSAAKGWHAATVPASFTAGVETFSSKASSGVRSLQVGSTMTWYRTDSTWEAWSEWFSLPVSAANPEELLKGGGDALGKVWFVIADSGYARGTADGKAWSRMPIPDFQPLLLTSERTPGVVAAMGLTPNFELLGGWSTDTGKTWTQGSLSVAGNILLLSEGGYEISATASLSGAMEMWISRSRTAGWESLGNPKGFFVDGGLAYVAKADGIYRVDGVASGLSGHGAGRADLRVVRGTSGLVAQVGAELAGAPWQLLGADGAVRASGTVRGTELSLPATRGAAWLKVGAATVALPSL